MIRNILKAEMILFYGELFRRKQMFFTMLLYPYVMTLFILFIGSSLGSTHNFEHRYGIHPAIFFMTASFLLLVVMGVVDDILWAPVYEDHIGTLPYLIMTPTPLFLRLFLIALPRLLLTILLGFTSIFPVFIYFDGIEGIIPSLLVMILAGISGILLSSLAIVIASVMGATGIESWRTLSIVRPILMILLGVYYPTYLMPYIVRALSFLIPSSHTIKLTLSILTAIQDLGYGLTLFAVAIVLFLIYVPLGYSGTKFYELSKLKRGVRI